LAQSQVIRVFPYDGQPEVFLLRWPAEKLTDPNDGSHLTLLVPDELQLAVGYAMPFSCYSLKELIP
jgi:hypothetical protein